VFIGEKTPSEKESLKFAKSIMISHIWRRAKHSIDCWVL